MNKSNFIQQLKTSIETDSFVRFTLSKNKDQSSDLKKVLIKLVSIKNAAHLSFVYRHQRKDVTKNFLLEAAYIEVGRLMSEQFVIYNLFTTTADWSGESLENGLFKIKQKPPTFEAKPDRAHDKTKNHLVGKTDYLQHLAITNAQGNIKKDKGDKYKQINKFIEIIDGLLKEEKVLLAKEKIRVVDMGAGKGYLTFALYDYLKNHKKANAEVTGVEIRPDLIEKCNNIATAVGFSNLTFEEGFINTFDLVQTDILIALHACDTATDDAIAKGIAAGAQLIVCAPCCHKQIRRAIKSSEQLQSVLDHGILKERQAEIVTDTIRALLLESQGYKTKVFEFISTEHTGKNVMIVGEKHERKVDKAYYQAEIEKLKSSFGIEAHYLEGLL
ncbi:MAG: SAM-dependent methyltransferase [Saprospiraceae bacterium]